MPSCGAMFTNSSECQRLSSQPWIDYHVIWGIGDQFASCCFKIYARNINNLTYWMHIICLVWFSKLDKNENIRISDNLKLKCVTHVFCSSFQYMQCIRKKRTVIYFENLLSGLQPTYAYKNILMHNINSKISFSLIISFLFIHSYHTFIHLFIFLIN